MRERASTLALLPAARGGDADAREALLELWAPVVLRWCLRLGGPGIDAEDAAHEVLERLLTRVHTLREPAAFSSWLFQTTRRVLGHHRRRAWLRRWVPGLVPERPDPRPDPREQVELSERARGVRDCLDALPAALREVLVLTELEGREGEEVAALLAIPLGTVKSRLRRARAAFEQQARMRGLAPDPDARAGEAE